jgi:translation initiation factor 3 subunit E
MVDGKDSRTSSWDLTSKVSPFLDLHMMFPLLEYIDSLIVNGTVSYSTHDVAASRMRLLKPTNMVDYAIDIYRELHGADAPIPSDMEVQKAKVFDKMEELRAGCKVLDALFQNEAIRVSYDDFMVECF